MLEMQRELLEAVGISTGKLTPEKVYDLASIALRDSELRTRAEEFITHGIMPKDARVQAIGRMSPAERLQLRERVTGVVPFKNS